MELNGKQIESLAFLTEVERAEFVAAINDPKLPELKKDILTSIAGQFIKWGNLSEKQVSAFLGVYRKITKVVDLVPVMLDEVVVFKGRVLRFGPSHNSMGIATTKYSFEGVDGTRYNIKTNSRKLGPRFQQAKEDGSVLTIEGKVTFIAPENGPVCLHPKTVKIIA